MQLIVVFVLGIFLAPAALAGSLEDIKAKVDGRLDYQDYAERDYRPLLGAGAGNCAVFAATYAAEASRQGIGGQVRTCLLSNGSGHAYFKAADGAVLDVRQPGVGTEPAVGCLKGSIRLVQAALAFAAR